MEEVDELNDLVSYFEDNAIIEQNKKMSKILAKNGIKIREHKWTEFEAS